ncbi:alpha/beta hydrolase [Nevskia sp.]|uniref:alpha/beta hydrolase n=1 Tax=Nevskia sp. TaxID=1929292 RepID=UPI00260120EF|nr:alpha/beta hydrolase [Nevskia sp.]
MPSKESFALEKLYRDWVAEMSANPGAGVDELRKLFDHWGDVTAEPGGVDYLETEAGSVPAMWAVPKGALTNKVLLCSHGGGYVVGSMYTHRKLFGHIAKAVGCRALIVHYGRAPENLHPGPVNDMVKAYRWLLETQGFKSGDVAFTGDSAGGALAVTTMAAAREQGLPLPAASMPMSPWAGADTSGESYDTNAQRDALVSRATSGGLGSLFLGEKGDLKDPLANPLYTDYRGMPPIYIQVGEAETLLDDSRRMAERAKQAGVDIKIDLFQDMQHVFHFLAGAAPEADDAIRRMAQWVRPKLGIA